MVEVIPQDTPPCPCCTIGVGIPVGVMVATGITLVTFRCSTCAYEWTEKRTDPSTPHETPDAA
jgi:hypothetical protein